MAFPNVKSILRIGSPLSSYKLLLVAASFSRPNYRGLFMKLLQPFIKDGEVSLRYRCYDRYFDTFLRISDLKSDFQSTRELGVTDAYHLNSEFKPDRVIDCGGNIGLFTLRAAASVSSLNGSPVKMTICEPLPRNIEQIKRTLGSNGVEADILPVCIGGERGSIPFYCRDANISSFDPTRPYTSVIEIPVILLKDAIDSHPAERILIKLDIEGMEYEVLKAFIPAEDRPVYLVGELHDYLLDAPRMLQLFQEHGWTVEFSDMADNIALFRGYSPAAAPLFRGTKFGQAA